MKKRITILIATGLLMIAAANAEQPANQAVVLNVIDNYGYSIYPYAENYFFSNEQPGNIPVTPKLAYRQQVKGEIKTLANEPYKFYIQHTTDKINKSIQSIELQNYSRWGIFALVFLMWFCQALTLVKED